MRFVRTAIIAAIASATIAGAALAGREDGRMMLVALPDGSVQHVRYEGDSAPQLLLVPIAAPTGLFAAAFGSGSPFAEMERISAAMDAQAAAMMRQAAAFQAQAPVAGQGVVITDAQGQPAGTMHYSFVSTTTSANGCTQTVSYSSDQVAATGEPKLIRTSSGDCASGADAPVAKPNAVIPAKAKSAPKSAPKITPVSVPAPLTSFTPSRT